MAVGDSTTSSLTHLEWRYTEWLVAHGGLRPDNVLDYFSESPFWDPTSNNAVLKMQTQFNELQAAQLDLKQMTGLEFAVVHERLPSLFVIRKQRRRSPTEVTPLATYYILNGNIYQSPDLYSVVSNRLLISLHQLTQAFHETRQYVKFHPMAGYTWKAPSPDQSGSAPETAQDESTANLRLQASREYHQVQRLFRHTLATAATKQTDLLRRQEGEALQQSPTMGPPAPSGSVESGMGTPASKSPGLGGDPSLKRKKQMGTQSDSSKLASAQKKRKKGKEATGDKI
ncbi:Mediator of RNA polymerase II transcription subunit 6 [Dispira parvispora]|uniref:Mediator of RNA polymerase II transcription subunit 6 n=1 Tax=Dispira parvispora TaxID=1520584 RepID=A0A9W8E1I4_9FUNG|nr:Mediator of RNA polymerase II transcription subunit 6 [Dispira parvispora]